VHTARVAFVEAGGQGHAPPPLPPLFPDPMALHVTNGLQGDPHARTPADDTCAVTTDPLVKGAEGPISVGPRQVTACRRLRDGLGLGLCWVMMVRGHDCVGL